MSESTKISVVRKYIDKLDSNDIDGSHELVTDDFVYTAEPKPTALGYASGFNKAEYKKYHATISQYASNFKVDTFIRKI